MFKLVGGLSCYWRLIRCSCNNWSLVGSRRRHRRFIFRSFIRWRVRGWRFIWSWRWCVRCWRLIWRWRCYLICCCLWNFICSCFWRFVRWLSCDILRGSWLIIGCCRDITWGCWCFVVGCFVLRTMCFIFCGFIFRLIFWDLIFWCLVFRRLIFWRCRCVVDVFSFVCGVLEIVEFDLFWKWK